MSITVRFAPSPTGMIHVGNARTALISWLFTRAQKGHFLLRIDDTDRERSKDVYEQALEDGLRWMGMDWDQKTRQRDRMDHYESKINKLKADGRLYPCYETAEELDLKRKSQLSRGLPPIYDREALSLTQADKDAYEAQGRRPHWRFRLEHTPIAWDDIVRGTVSFNGADLSDPVLIREDGSPLYHICSVVDDIDYGISHIIRGEDHVSNTACHIQMFEALGARPPIFAHLPLLSDIKGGKLSKRIGSMSLNDLRDTGIEPMALVSLMARLGTSDPIEPFTDINALIETFDLSKFSRGMPKFDDEALRRLNAKILHMSDYDSVKDKLDSLGLEEMDAAFWEAVRPNIEILPDAQEWWRVANGPVTPQIDDPTFIEDALALLPPAPWNEDTWALWTKDVKEKTGRKGKDLFLPLRRALTGMDRGPELAQLLLLIGEEKTKKRLQSHKEAA